MKYLALFRWESRIVAAQIPNTPTSLVWKGERLKKRPEYVGDFNHLLDSQGLRAGYEFPFISLSGLDFSKFRFFQAENANLSGQQLRIDLRPSGEGSLTSDCCLAIGAEIFSGTDNELFLVLPTLAEADESWIEVKTRPFGFSFVSGTLHSCEL